MIQRFLSNHRYGVVVTLLAIALAAVAYALVGEAAVNTSARLLVAGWTAVGVAVLSPSLFATNPPPDRPHPLTVLPAAQS